MSLFTKIFGTPSQRELKSIYPIADKVDQLEEEYKKLTHGRKIMDAVSEVHGLCGYDNYDSAGEMIGKAFGTLNSVVSYDDQLNGLCEQLGTIDSLLNDFARELAQYMDDFDFSEERLAQIEERLNLINKLKMKHGKTIEKILEVKAEKEERIEKLQNYDLYLEKQKNWRRQNIA